ncbi:hypothetical protein ACRPM7_22485, partial [Burkholderia vietnamiensis]
RACRLHQSPFDEVTPDARACGRRRSCGRSNVTPSVNIHASTRDVHPRYGYLLTMRKKFVTVGATCRRKRLLERL